MCSFSFETQNEASVLWWSASLNGCVRMLGKSRYKYVARKESRCVLCSFSAVHSLADVSQARHEDRAIEGK